MADLAWLSPKLEGIDRMITLNIDATVSLRHARLRSLTVTDSRGVDLSLTATARNLDTPDDITAAIDRLELSVDGNDAAAMLQGISPDAAKILARCTHIAVN